MGRALDLSIRLDPGGEVFNRRFTRFVSELTDLTDAFEEMVGMFGAFQESVFASQGAISGPAWAPLAESTVRRKGSGSILVDSGALRASLTDPAHLIEPRRLALWTDVRYAGFHQTGTRRMPARPPIRLSERLRDDWSRLIHVHLIKAAGRLQEG